jgi:O-antigen ligase
MTIVLIFITFDTWWQFFSGSDIFGFIKSGNRLTGPFNKPHVGAWIAKLSLLPPLLLVLYGGIKSKEHPSYLPIGFLLFLTFIIFSVFITGERMALLLTLASFIIIFFGLILDKKITIKTAILICLLNIGGVVLFVLYFPEISERSLHSSIIKILNWKTSDYGYIWKTSYEVWMQSPFFGVGLHKYREACYSLADAGLISIKNIDPGALCFHPHNITLQLLSETGIIGFVLFYAMVLSLGYSSLKQYILNKEWFFFSITFSILFSCFLPIASNTSFFANKYGAIVWLLIGVMFSITRHHQKKVV